MALVTGSGRAIAARFAREGADVAISHGHNADEAEEARREVEATGRKAVVIRADLGLGRLDILVNNAGIEVDGPFVDATEEDDKILDVNLRFSDEGPGVLPRIDLC